MDRHFSSMKKYISNQDVLLGNILNDNPLKRRFSIKRWQLCSKGENNTSRIRGSNLSAAENGYDEEFYHAQQNINKKRKAVV